MMKALYILTKAIEAALLLVLAFVGYTLITVL